MLRQVVSAFTYLAWVALSTIVQAQGLQLEGLQLESSFGARTPANAEVTARLHPTSQPGIVRLDVMMKLDPGTNTYSQSSDFAKPTKIIVNEPLEPAGGDFQPDHAPKRSYDENFEKEVEKFVGSVTFSRVYRLPEGAQAATLAVTGVVDALICNENECLPRKFNFVAQFDPSVVELAATPASISGSAQAPTIPPARSDPFSTGYVQTPSRGSGANASPDPIRLQFELSQSQANAGEVVRLAVTMTLDQNWQTYAIDPAPGQLEVPTSFKFSELQNLKPQGEIRSSPAPVVHKTDVGVSHAHPGQVTWLQEFQAESTGPIGLQGTITYQICEEGTRCKAPHRVAFRLGSLYTSATDQNFAAVTTSFLSPAEGPTTFEVEDGWKIESLGLALPFAFVVGLILNLMPCVLPVLAIKILSFVQQAGESRSRVLALNLTYTAGVVAVFLVLAALALFANLAFGELFQNVYFNVAMICVVFAMALSLLGVFELPVPGLIPSAGSHQEGLAGAFTTGMIATILGTPCTGPFIAPVFGWLLKQPPMNSFLFFGTMGFGMASPYFIAGFFPAIVNWLPKPGMWMVRFKQFSGFILLATVIFLMYSLDQRLVIPILILLLGCALFLWMVGHLYNEVSPRSTKWRVRILATALSAPMFYLGLSPIVAPLLRSGDMEVATELPWEPFTEQRMLELRDQGKPILIDFTANWCAVCKTNEQIALNTKSTLEFVEKHNVVTLVADYTQESPEIKKWLNAFGQDSVPLTIIVPKGTGRKLIPLRGLFTQGILLEQLQRAVAEDVVASAVHPADSSRISSTR